MEKRGYSEVEAAVYLGCSARLIREQVAKGNLPVHYLGAKKLYDRDDLDAFFKALPAERG
jgi:excisionase family DNA binding protein